MTEQEIFIEIAECAVKRDEALMSICKMLIADVAGLSSRIERLENAARPRRRPYDCSQGPALN